LYFSADDQYGGLLVKTDFNAELLEGENFQGPEDRSDQKQPTFKSTELKEYNRFMKAVNLVLNEKDFSDHFEFYPVGNPVLMGFAFETMEREMGMLFGGLLLLIILVLWVIFRSLSAVVWPVTLVVCTLVWVMGINGWVGIPVSNMNEIIVFLVLAVGIADSIHILSGYLFYRNQMFDHLSALRQVYQKSGLACLLTSVTTSVGLIVLIFVPIVPIRNFAVFAALGVLLVFLLTIVLLPLMLDLWNPVSKKRALSIKNSAGKIHVLQKLLQRFEILNHKRPATIIAIFIVSGITLLYGATKIKVDTNQIESIDQETLIRKSYDLVDLKMGGTGNMEIMIDTGIDNGFKNPDLLKAIENLQENLIGRFGDKVVRTQSIVDVVKDSFQAINEGDETKRIIPTDPMVLGQTMFLFENVDPEERSKWISENYQVGRVGINARNMGSLEGKLFMERVQGLIQENIEPIKKDFPDLKLTLTGQIPLMNKLSNFISHSQLKSFAITMVVISVMLLFVFGSFRIGLIAILPNLMPMIAIFGVMGFLDIGLDMHLMLVAPITIGIAVDDTIHFLTHYRLEFEKTKKVGMSIQRAFREAGQAILFTSLVLSVGFFIFIFSTNRGFEYFGIFSGLAIVIALLADLFFLPSIITLLFKPKAAQKR
ncbi:MAG: efflux RND transporter permease subunit, partial [Deltaproteobacteria bacterium]|nr:efflux RND transporter permease subunit [Deltaproteobacteria bacterium]